jgi:hypothetical protein
LFLKAAAAAVEVVAAATETAAAAKEAAKAAAATAGSNGSGDAVELLLRRGSPGAAAQAARLDQIAGMAVCGGAEQGAPPWFGRGTPPRKWRSSAKSRRSQASARLLPMTARGRKSDSLAAFMVRANARSRRPGNDGRERSQGRALDRCVFENFKSSSEVAEILHDFCTFYSFLIAALCSFVRRNRLIVII